MTWNEFGRQFTSIKGKILNNNFWSTVIKNYRNKIPIIFINFLSLLNHIKGSNFLAGTNFCEDRYFINFQGIKFYEFYKIRVSQ